MQNSRKNWKIPRKSSILHPCKIPRKIATSIDGPDMTNNKNEANELTTTADYCQQMLKIWIVYHLVQHLLFVYIQKQIK